MSFGNSLYFFSQATATLADAVAACASLDSILAELHTEEEDKEIQLVAQILRENGTVHEDAQFYIGMLILSYDDELIVSS